MTRYVDQGSQEPDNKAALLLNLLIGVLLSQCATQLYTVISNDTGIGGKVYGVCLCVMWGLFHANANVRNTSKDDDMAFDELMYLTLGGILGEVVLSI